jgi:hypothetical protein
LEQTKKQEPSPRSTYENSRIDLILKTPPVGISPWR